MTFTKLISLAGLFLTLASTSHAETLPETVDCSAVAGQYGSFKFQITNDNPLTIVDPFVAEDDSSYTGVTNGGKAPDGSTWQIQGGLDQEITLVKTQLYKGIVGERSQYRYTYTMNANRSVGTEQIEVRNKSLLPGPWTVSNNITFDCKTTTP